MLVNWQTRPAHTCVHASLSRGVPYIVLEQFYFTCSLRSKRVGVSHDLERKMSELCAWPLSTLNLALCTQVWPLIQVAGQFTFPFTSRKQDWKKHWYFLTLTRLHSTMVSEWNFVLDSALERAWKITWVELWECRKLSFVLFLFYSIASKISGGKKIWDTLQKQSAHKLNCSRLFYLVSMRAKTF